MGQTFVITKLKTTNVGNQALTQELVDMFIDVHPKNKFIFEGRPMGLDGYTIDRLSKSQDAILTFEKWAKNIADKSKEIDSITFKSLEFVKPQVKLISFSNEDAAVERIKSKYLRPLKRYLSRYIVYAPIYKNRLALIKQSETLIYSGAGEVGDNNVFLRQLLEIRVAQLLGIKTAIVNQSVVLKTKLFYNLTGYVYGKLNQLVVRGSVSKNNLISYGVDASKILMAPDTAFRTSEPDKNLASELAKKYSISDNTVGINITNWFKTDYSKLDEIITIIKNSGYEMVFITNEPFEDNNIGLLFEEKYNIPFIKDKLPYKDYAALLSNLNFLISARLHSNVLALTARTKIIPIEGNVFKTTELLELAKYPIKVIDSSSQSWESRLHTEVNNVLEKKYDFEKYFNDVLPVVQSSVVLNATWLNDKN